MIPELGIDVKRYWFTLLDGSIPFLFPAQLLAYYMCQIKKKEKSDIAKRNQ